MPKHGISNISARRNGSDLNLNLDLDLDLNLNLNLNLNLDLDLDLDLNLILNFYLNSAAHFFKALKQFQKDEPWPRSPLRSLQFSAGNKHLGLIVFLSKAA